MSVRADVIRKWECGSCNELHDHEHQAEECCAPEVTAVWVCPVCDEGHDKKEEAEACCPDIETTITCPRCFRDHSIGTLNYEAVKVARHCNTCMPIFTVDQQLAIQDLHYQRTGNFLHLHD